MDEKKIEEPQEGEKDGKQEKNDDLPKKRRLNPELNVCTKLHGTGKMPLMSLFELPPPSKPRVKPKPPRKKKHERQQLPQLFGISVIHQNVHGKPQLERQKTPFALSDDEDETKTDEEKKKKEEEEQQIPDGETQEQIEWRKERLVTTNWFCFVCVCVCVCVVRMHTQYIQCI